MEISSETPVPKSWRANQSSIVTPLDTAALAHWWKRFQDPVLNQLVQEAMQHSPDVRSALVKIEESRAYRLREQSGLFPTLDFSGSAQNQKNKNHDTNITTQSHRYSTALDARWEVDLFGRQRQLLRAASSDFAQAQENYHAVQVSLTAEVAQSYVALRQAQQELELREQILKTRRDTTQIAQWREQSGVGASLDSLHATTQLEQESAAIPTIRQTIEQTKNQLSLLCGLTPGALDQHLNRARAIPLAPARLAIGIPAQTLQQRPDVRAAVHGVEAAVARKKAAQRERLPTLNLSGSIGLEALKSGKLFSPETVAGSLLGGLSAPIFDAGRISQNIAIQDAQTKQAIISYESAVLTALSDVENALIAIQRKEERLKQLAKAISSAQQTARLAEQQYQAGLVNLLQVLEAQRTLFSLQEQEVSTRADHVTAHIQLYKALGGGWSSH